MKVIHRIALNLVTGWVAKLINALIGLVLVPFLLHQLGREGYGLIALALSIVWFAGLTDLGLRGALRRHLSVEIAGKDLTGLNEVASSGFFLYSLMGMALSAACFAGAPWLARAFHVSGGLQGKAVFLIRWYSSTLIFLAFLKPVFAASITCNNRFDVFNNINSGVTFLRGLGILVFIVWIGHPFYTWIAVNMAAELLLFAILLFFAFRVQPGLRIRPADMRGKRIVELFGFGKYMYILQISNFMNLRADPIIISSFLGPAAIALYAPAKALLARVRPLIDVFIQQLDPLATQYHVSGMEERLHKMLIRGTRFRWLMGIGSSLLFLSFAKPVIYFWVGKRLGADYLVTVWVLAGWAVIELTNFAEGTQWPVLFGTGKVRFYVGVQMVSALGGIVGAILMLWLTGLGVIGIVIPRMIIEIIKRPILLVHTSRVAGVALRHYLHGAYLRPFIVLVILVTEASVSQWIVPPESIGRLFFLIAVYGISWLVCCWTIGFAGEDRAMFRELGVTLLRKVRQRGDGCPSEVR